MTRQWTGGKGNVERQVDAVLHEIHASGTEHDAREDQHGRKMLNLEPETARLLDILIRSGGYRHLLEIGTSSGYSTLWLANAARDLSGGRVVSIEISAAKQQLADANLRRAGLRENVDLRLGDAASVLSDLTEAFDFVFLDADRLRYPELLPLILPRLEQKAMLCADNALSHPQEIAAYLKMVAALPGFHSIVVNIGKGLSLAYRDAS